jgi:uncharacterized protein YndB with AHSA1/START domain
VRSLAAVIFLLAPAWATAEVADQSANGFTVKTTLNIEASPGDVYRKIVRNVGDWWDSSHTFSQNAHNLTIDEKPGGCFCEKLPDGGGVRHMEVINFAPGKLLVLSGALGPLQSLAATGSMTIKLSPADKGTKLEVSYAIVGYMPGGMNTLAAPVDGVLRGLFTRLKSYCETGQANARAGSSPQPPLAQSESGR